MRHLPGTVAALALAAMPAVAQAPIGPEFRVNTYTTGSQHEPSVAVDAAGGFVVAWTTFGGVAGEPVAVAGQRFDAAGASLGSEFLISDPAAQSALAAHVAADPGGGFAVAWTQAASDTDLDVRVRRYDANGTPRGASFRVPTTGGNQTNQMEPSIAVAANGSFVVAWTSEFVDGSGVGIDGQRFDAGGAPLGGEFLVNSYLTGDQVTPDVAMDGAGNFLVVWANTLGPPAISAQRFTAAGAPIGSEFAISEIVPPYVAGNPHLAMQADGAFVVAWQDRGAAPSQGRVRAARFDAAGIRLGGELLVAPSGASGGVPQFTSGGRFVVAWTQQSCDGSDSCVEARWFAANGTSGPPLRVNTSTLGAQGEVALGAAAGGRVVAAWVSQHESPFGDVFAQRHGLLEPRALAVDTVAGPLSNGNRVLEPSEQVDVRPSWANNAAGAQSLDGAVTAFGGPPGAIYLLVDGAGSYGSVPAGGTQGCLDCYAVIVAQPLARPSLHWDATATEVINPGDDGHFAWTLHVGDSFSDVARGNPFYRFVETLLHRGISTGCGGASFCPASATTRAQMAPFLLVAKEGAGYLPRDCVVPTVFADVPFDDPFCRWIEELARRGVTGGCGGGNYCPTDPVTREQMAVFLLRTLDPTLSPPACTTPMFGDVPASSGFCRWIEELARRGVTAGCGGGNYCPAQPVTREQMAVFLTTTFGLTLYGP